MLPVFRVAATQSRRNRAVVVSIRLKEMAHALARKTLFALALLACAPAFAEEQPPARVGRVSFISGTLAFYGPGDSDWSAAKINYPVAGGEWFATDPQSRAEIRIGAETI